MRFLTLSLLFFAPLSLQATETLKFRLTAQPATLDWNLAHSSHETYLIMNLMEGLLTHGDKLKPTPALAESWAVSEDGKTYTFQIRKDVLWSDGKPLVAQHFVDSWIRVLRPRTRSRYASFLYPIRNAKKFHQGKINNVQKLGIEAKGAHQFIVHLEEVTPDFLHVPTFWITFPIRMDLIRKNPSTWSAPGKLTTLGPFLLASSSKGRIVLKRNPTYYGQKPDIGFDQVEAIVVKSDQDARQRFFQGEFDFLLNATTEDLLQVRTSKQKNIRVGQYPYLATYYLGFRVQKGLLKNNDLRRAIAIGLDRRSIPAALQGGQSSAIGLVPPGILGHASGVEIQGTLYDARGALTRAGFTEGAGLPILKIFILKFDGAKKLGETLQARLKEKLGIKTEFKLVETPAFNDAIKNNQVDLFVKHWGADYPDPSNFFEVFQTSSKLNSTGWSDQQYDQNVRLARKTLDEEKRKAYYKTAEEILLKREVAIVPLFYTRNIVLLSGKIKSFEISPLNYLFLQKVRLKAQP